MSNNKNRNKNNINKTIMIKKVSNNKNKKKEIEKKNEESTKYKKKVENSRIKKNESLYDNENLNFTKQQKFNFESYQFEDEMDTIFLDKRKKKRVESKNLKKELIKVKKQKKRYKINFFITLLIQSFAFILLSEKLILTNVPFTLKAYGFFVVAIKSNILSSLHFFLLIFISSILSTSSGLISSIGIFLHLSNFSLISFVLEKSEKHWKNS